MVVNNSRTSLPKAVVAFVIRGAGVIAIALVALTQTCAAQSMTSLGVNSKSTPSASTTDPLKRTTPRSSILGFLEASHGNNHLLAAQYLDLQRIRSDRRATEGSELATELAAILDRDPKFEVEHLSNSPEGNLADGLAPNLDELDSFELEGQTIPLELERENQSGEQIWLVSADSVARIPQLETLAHESPIEKRLPQALVTTTFIDTPLWIWFALVLLALVLSLVSRVLSRIFIVLLRPLIRRYAKSTQTYRLEAFAEPLRLLLSIVVFRICMEAIAPSALARDYILRLLAFLFILGTASFVMRVVDVISDQAISRMDPRQRALSYSVFPLFVRVVKIFIFCIAGLFVLSAWGYSTGTILTGVGVGGIAIALAAQKTLENLFGSISIISDRPVLVGDFCQFGNQSGTVEDIGLRSTRIRTLDRTVVTIPNSVFSTMTLENYSRRDRFWFHPTLRLRRDTSSGQLEQMMDAVTKLLQEHPKVDASGLPVRFTNIAKESFDLEIFAYILTTDGNEYLKVQSELLLALLEAAARVNVGFAVPFQESVTTEAATS